MAVMSTGFEIPYGHRSLMAVPPGLLLAALQRGGSAPGLPSPLSAAVA